MSKIPDFSLIFQKLPRLSDRKENGREIKIIVLGGQKYEWIQNMLKQIVATFKHVIKRLHGVDTGSILKENETTRKRKEQKEESLQGTSNEQLDPKACMKS